METLAICIGLGIMAIAITVAVMWTVEKRSALNKLKLRQPKHC
ncbi:MAG: hypothetical protein N4J56_004296 [Chroococcidiopsis sp. SAG 2025]|nr:hypothetical protein [Chroococcidiopsis sp. SAG 2025]MDV2994642.1 hypothetical protein [Chroococcidiopsis sp. SAG 2025]